jgi:thiopeptide-type bacteriocin biosynthesis protein
MLRHESYFILRTPLYPYDTADSLDTVTLIKKFSDPSVQEAIFLASPTFFQKLAPFINCSADNAEARRIKLSLQKYLLRFSRRSTPFALFAGITNGVWADQTDAVLRSEIVRHTRLDANCVSVLVATLLKRDHISNVLKFFPNDTLYKIGNKLRYVEYQVSNRRVYSLSNLDSEVSVNLVLAHARSGKDKKSLCGTLVENGWDHEQAILLINEMITNQLLVSELDMSLTNGDYFSNVMEVLEQRGVRVPELEGIYKQLRIIDQQEPSQNLTTYPILINRLQELTGNTGYANVLQVDACRQGTVKLNRKIAASIEKGVDLLSRIMPYKENKTIAAFRKAFFERYEYETVDLCVALDPEIGIGYPVRHAPHVAESFLLKDLHFAESKEPKVLEGSDFQTFLLRKYSDALAHRRPITLMESELEPFLKSPKLPASLYAFVSLFARPGREGDCDIYIKGAHGPSAATLIGRFCHLSSDLTTRVRETLKKEELSKAEAIFAEVIHANEARIGNISTRPALRSYEIPILAKSGVDREYTINVSDLTISYADDRLMLRSKKMNCEVVPRLSSAHNFTNDTISLYRLLCDLQYEGIQSTVAWDWGILSEAPYLPLVRIGDLILSPAKWHLSKQEIKAIQKTKDLPSIVDSLRTQHQICRHVLVGEGDHKMVIDLEDKEQLPLFRKVMETSNAIEQCLNNGRDFVFYDRTGSGYANELIVPLENVDPMRNRGHASSFSIDMSAERTFPLGSAWMYYKIHCSTVAADQVLREFVRPLTTSLLNDKVIDRWFFIRYDEHDNHIRLRLHGEGLFYNGVIQRVNLLSAPLLQVGLITKIVTDVYRRELERYGPENIALSEELFFIDSECVALILERLGEQSEVLWQVGLALTDHWFSNFDISLEERTAIVRELQQQFFKEFKVDQATKKSLASKLRTNRRSIELVLNGQGVAKSVADILSLRKEKMHATTRMILHLATQKKLSVPLASLLKSYIHLSINRLMSANQRYHEMVLYDFLYQAYHVQTRKIEIH